VRRWLHAHDGFRLSAGRLCLADTERNKEMPLMRKKINLCFPHCLFGERLESLARIGGGIAIVCSAFTVGQKLLAHSKSAEFTARRGLAVELYPFIYGASSRMSAPAISKFLAMEIGRASCRERV